MRKRGSTFKIDMEMLNLYPKSISAVSGINTSGVSVQHKYVGLYKYPGIIGGY